MHTVFHLLQEKRCLHGPDGCVPKNRVIMCNYVCIYIYIHKYENFFSLYRVWVCSPKEQGLVIKHDFMAKGRMAFGSKLQKTNTLWSEWTASSWISFRCAFLLCSNCLFSYLWNSSWKKVPVKQSCFGPGFKIMCFSRGEVPSATNVCLGFLGSSLEVRSKWSSDLQTLRTTPFVVIHSLSSGTPLNESMRLFKSMFLKTQSYSINSFEIRFILRFRLGWVSKLGSI